jgi:hypothetical protein
MRHAALALIVTSLATSVAEAQPQPPSPAPLPRTVRVLLRNQDTVQGYLRGRSKDEVVIYTNKGQYRHLALSDVQRFEVQSRVGSHARRGALIGVAVWIGAVAAASRGSLEIASAKSGALLAGSVGLGALIGSRVPRHGWRTTEASTLAGGATAPGLQVTLRF